MGSQQKTLLMIYRSLIRSILDYGAVALDSMSESNKKKLDVIQMKALRIASGAILWYSKLSNTGRHGRTTVAAKTPTATASVCSQS